MHPRNPYRDGIDFAELAETYDALKSHLISEPASTRKTIDFKDVEAQRRLTEAIMLRDFGVKLYIPPDRLCPPVPNRLNYILWIQDIMRAHEDVLGTKPASIRGIDIGTGATAIYAFLACKMGENWSMVATEIDDFSYETAQRNIHENSMQSRIDLRKASSEGRILFPLENEDDTYHFTLCNPPFYSSPAEIASLAEEKALPPNAVCTGAPVEMIYTPTRSTEAEGGEAGFVSRMVEESVVFGTRCRWYTSMLGKLSSVLSIVAALRKHNITNYALTEFVQGQTRRWAVGWSFTDTRLPDTIARISPFIGPSHALYSVLPPRNTLSTPLPLPASDIQEESRREAFEACIVKALQETLEGIDDALITRIQLATDSGSVSDSSGESPDRRTPHSQASPSSEDQLLPPQTTLALFFVEAMHNTWSRAARRKKAKGKEETKQDGDEISGPSATPVERRLEGEARVGPALSCSVRLVRAPTHVVSRVAAGPELELEFQWVFGKDRPLFEAFSSHVGRKVAAVLAAPLPSA